MKKSAIAYFDSQILPVLKRDWATLLPEMSIQILGSVGLGIDDERSDLEAVIYLPEALWRREGAGLQLSLIHISLRSRIRTYLYLFTGFPDHTTWAARGQGAAQSSSRPTRRSQRL